jgi:hypothetical protein
LTASGYEGSLMLAALASSGEAHMFPNKKVLMYATRLKSGIMKEGRTEATAPVHAEEAICAVILTASPMIGICGSRMA